MNRSWLAFRFFNVVSFVYNPLVCQRQLRWSANPVTSVVRLLTSRDQTWTMCRILPIVLAIAFSNGTCVVADDDALPPKILDVEIQLNPQLLRSLSSPSVALIKALHDQRESDLLRNLGIATDPTRKADGRFQKKRLAFHRIYRLGDGIRNVFVFDPVVHSWPGTQPETIVITDAAHRVLGWKEVGGSPMFAGAAFEDADDTGPVLLITREHRHTIPNPKRGIYRFSLNNDTITPNPEIEWLYKDDAERAQYARWRKALREHERANEKTADEPIRF